MNPLLEIQFRFPFDRITPADVEPAIDELIADASQRLEQAAVSDDPLSAYDVMTEQLDYAMGVVRHLECGGHLRRVARGLQRGAARGERLLLETSRCTRDCGRQSRQLRLDRGRPGRGRRAAPLPHQTIDTFRRHGADLDPAGKKRLEEIDVELTRVTTKFGKTCWIPPTPLSSSSPSEEQLAGLPPSGGDAAARAQRGAQGRYGKGWRFTLPGPRLPRGDDLPGRPCRAAPQVYQAYSLRATEPQRDNRPLIARILELRREKARLLGFADFADLVARRPHGPQRRPRHGSFWKT